MFTVTENTLSKAEKRMSFYGFDRVILAVRNSNEYTQIVIDLFKQTKRLSQIDNNKDKLFY